MVLMAGLTVCRGTTYYVATTGSDSDGLGTTNSPWLTISNGVAHATTDGDMVYVSAGTYQVTTNITIQANAITLRGADRASTFIQGMYSNGVGPYTNRGLYINNSGATVEEFTVWRFGMTNTDDRSGYGGGVYLENGTLNRCVITTNVARSGGGVYNNLGLVTDCVISSNTAVREKGGGLSQAGASALAWNCTIAANVVTNEYGGGINLAGGSVIECIISNNVSCGGTNALNKGGGCTVSGGIISNCTIANNRAIPGSCSGGGINGASAVGQSKLYSSIIRNNSATYGGGGVLLHNAWLVQDCTIEGNTADKIGGGVQVSSGDSTTLLTNCIIRNNVSSNGAGINSMQFGHSGLTAAWCRITGNMITGGGGAGIKAGSLLFLDHCVIEQNVATNGAADGAGIYLGMGGAGAKYPDATIRNCIIANNTAWGTTGRGGGIYVEAVSTSIFSACTIAGNVSKNNGGGIYLADAGSNTFTNCIVVSNTLAVSAVDNDIYIKTSDQTNSFYYCCSERLTNTAQGNITASPVFTDIASGNYRLKENSPGINAGTNESWMTNGVDLDSRARIRYNTVDMGAYEHIYDAMIYRSW